MPLPLRSACLLGLVSAWGVALAASPQESLRADHAAWSEARAAYDSRVAAGRLGAAERSDYEAYLDELAARVVGGCRAMQAQGEPPPEEVNCPVSPPSARSIPSTDGVQGVAGTPDPAELDAELGKTLGDFDELLLREQDRVRASRTRDGLRGGNTASSASGEGDRAAGSDDQEGSAGASAAAGSETSASQGEGATAGTGTGSASQGLPGGRPGDQAGTASGAGEGDPGLGGPGAAGGRGMATATPADLPDPSGDDVVARQLREAAEAERDPELRARLWDEYRRYRRGIN